MCTSFCTYTWIGRFTYLWCGGQFHLITGQFLNAETEASYQEHIAHRMQREHTLLLSTIIVAMLFMHTYVYFQSEYTHHSRYSISRCVICSTRVCRVNVCEGSGLMHAPECRFKWIAGRGGEQK